MCATLAIMCAIVSACSGSGGTPDTITGLITEVRNDSAGNAEFIKLRDRDDRFWELPVEFDPGAEVPAYHLEEHRVQRLPVVVRVRESANGLYAAAIDDLDPPE
jgi:hypothetical protein